MLKADVDGSCWPRTEVVFRGRKLHCGPWTEVISHATPPHLVKVKINFDEAQKLTWKEIKCLYGLIKKKKPQITFPNEKCNLNREAERFTPRGPVAGSFQHTLWPRERALEVATLVSRAFAFVFSWYKVIIALSLYFSSWALQHTVHISIIAAKIVSLGYFSSSNISVRTWGSLEQKQQYQSGQYKMQTADRRPQTGYNMQTRYKMQTADWVQNAD